MDKADVFKEFKELCASRGLLDNDRHHGADDVQSGVYDDGTLLRFLRARDFDVQAAFEQYQTARKWRDANRLIELYESIEVSDYEETRKLYTHWTGRRDRKGTPLMLFEIGRLTPTVMAAYEKACRPGNTSLASTESDAMLRLFCTYENLIRFVLPLCSAVPSRPDPDLPITDTTCIVDISGVTLMQFWRLRTHLQAASVLASSYYPETLGKTYIVGAPSFFPTIWAWISKWFAQNTVSKIHIIPHGKEHSVLSDAIDPRNIPQRYGGEFPFEFGMLPSLDPEITEMVTWSSDSDGNLIQEMPKGPLKWVEGGRGTLVAVAVGTENGTKRKSSIMKLATDVVIE